MASADNCTLTRVQNIIPPQKSNLLKNNKKQYSGAFGTICCCMLLDI